MSERFDEALATREHPVATDYSSPSNSLLAAFGGICAGMGMPPFEFFRLAEDIPAKKMFVRDIEQAWYQRGLPGISHDIPSTAEYLRREIDGQNVERTVFVGNSMGGFAAILFGCLLNVDVVHAFAPQTFINRFLRIMRSDRRWSKQMRRLRRNPPASRFYDLRHVLESHQPRTQIHLHFARGHRLDRVHSERLQGIPNVTLHPSQSDSHRLIKQLRNEGILKNLLHQSLVSKVSRAA